MDEQLLEVFFAGQQKWHREVAMEQLACQGSQDLARRGN